MPVGAGYTPVTGRQAYQAGLAGSATNLDNFAWGMPLWLLQAGKIYEGSLDVVESVLSRSADPIPAVGVGDNSLTSSGEYAGPGPLPPYQEVCWRDVDTGQVACFDVNSVFRPGGVWGPAGNWVLDDATHPPPIAPEYLPTRRVEEPEPQEVSIVPGHSEVGWGDFLLGTAYDVARNYFGGATDLSFAPTGTGDAGTINGAAMPSYSGSCPPRKTRTLTIDCATGQEVKRTRRRRRRLLTSSDLGDLAQLQALVGKGSNAMSVAVSKAIR